MMGMWTGKGGKSVLFPALQLECHRRVAECFLCPRREASRSGEHTESLKRPQDRSRKAVAVVLSDLYNWMPDGSAGVSRNWWWQLRTRCSAFFPSPSWWVRLYICFWKLGRVLRSLDWAEIPPNWLRLSFSHLAERGLGETATCPSALLEVVAYKQLSSQRKHFLLSCSLLI